MRLAEWPNGWYVEEGIGEERAVLVDGGEAIAARVRWPGRLEAGLVEDAVLSYRNGGTRRGTARFANDEHALVDGLPRDANEGATLRLEITRSGMAEYDRDKLAHARPSDRPVQAAPSLATVLGARVVASFPPGIWEDVVADASHRKRDFVGGLLIVSLTPAMTVIDIDGALPPRELALAAVPALALAIRRMDLAGSIGIDFPTLPDKTDRRAVDVALDIALADWPHERTAMNGFGFVQLVARLERPSLAALFRRPRDEAFARVLLRKAERIAEPGALMLCASDAVRQCIQGAREAELARRTGRMIVWSEDSPDFAEFTAVQAVPL